MAGHDGGIVMKRFWLLVPLAAFGLVLPAGTGASAATVVA